MILVNNPGSWGAIYAPLRHAEWNGWTPTDLVFPFFVFCVGVAIPFALERRVEAGAARTTLLPKILRRTLILFALGLFLAAYPIFSFEGGFGLRPQLASLRIPGVLQRLALCYGATALCALFLRPRHIPWLITILLLGYWAILVLVPIPPAGTGPWLRADLLQHDQNIGAWLDRRLLSGHLWSASKTWDPEGLLSTLPAIASCLLGVLAGRLLRRDEEPWQRVTWLFSLGCVLAAAGSLWDYGFAINKGLWSSSYVLFTGGLACCGLALCHVFADLQRDASGVDSSRVDASRVTVKLARFFESWGRNPIAAFVVSGLVAKSMWLIQIEGKTVKSLWYSPTLATWLPPKLASLAHALIWVGAIYAMLRYLDRRGIVIRI